MTPVTEKISRDRLFYGVMSVAILVTVLIGFAPTYYLKGYYRAASLTPLVHLHGLVFTSWILLFFAQTVLIAARRTQVHRRLGKAGAVMTPLVTGVGLTTAIVAGRRNLLAGQSDAVPFLAIPVTDMVVFLVLASIGLLYRHRADVHKRVMLLATIGLIDAAIARWPLSIIRSNQYAFFEFTDLFIAALVMFDLVSRRRIHPATAWGGLLIVSSQPLRLVVSHTQVWAAVATALLR